MYIRSIELENIRCFEQIKVEFGSGADPAAWNLILGDNGVGKSTLLRALALGLSPPDEASALLKEAGHSWLRHSDRRGIIRVGWGSESVRGEREFQIEIVGDGVVILSVESHSDNPDALPTESLGEWREQRTHKICVCGYGAGRSLFGDRSIGRYTVREAVLNLFEEEGRLQNPELVLHRLALLPDVQRIFEWVDRILMLPKDSTRLTHEGLLIDGPWGTNQPVRSLGDGYRSTLSWILDFLGWHLALTERISENGLNGSNKDVKGIILIDEIEQHLHPEWQRRILKLLHEQFPKVQFIATSHSPMCVIGTTDFADEDVSLTLLREGEDGVEACTNLKPPRGRRADQVLTSSYFGLDTTSDDQTKEDIERLSALLSLKKRSKAEDEKVEYLRRELKLKLGCGETELDREAEAFLDWSQARAKSLSQ